MASLRRLPNSKFWIACFTLPDGTRTQRSTKVPVVGVRPSAVTSLTTWLTQVLGAEVKISASQNSESGFDAREARRLAQRIANHFEDTSRDARAGRLTEDQARRVVAEIYVRANKEALPSSTIAEFFESWLKRKEIEAHEHTHQRYVTAIKHLITFMGNRAKRDISHLSVKDITALRDQLAEKLSPTSANFTVKVLRAALNQARRDGVVSVNEASRVILIQRVRKVDRRPFTFDELKKILAIANEEWRGMILTGLYTGLRLGDIAALRWNNIDLQNRELTLTTEKTGRRQVLPIAMPLYRHLQSLASSDNPQAPIFPDAAGFKERSGGVGTLSNQFYGILVSAGLALKRSHKKPKVGAKGRDAARASIQLSFHCMRYTATSLLKNAGVSDVVARDIIGHESTAVSANYTHIEMETKRQALDRLPDLNG